ncbi:hypothetical protein NPIL_617591 [Nephila pilipes]|uniref:Uncharacterized protein n=1 Tax=Nephila pilipes TaxID=299642 RepID=A0A8X6U8K1_NEPPI|nr:hypothetical protein NPIL_617591 [Nephila pilipes]
MLQQIRNHNSIRPTSNIAKYLAFAGRDEGHDLLPSRQNTRMVEGEQSDGLMSKEDRKNDFTKEKKVIDTYPSLRERLYVTPDEICPLRSTPNMDVDLLQFKRRSSVERTPILDPNLTIYLRTFSIRHSEAQHRMTE